MNHCIRHPPQSGRTAAPCFQQFLCLPIRKAGKVLCKCHSGFLCKNCGKMTLRQMHLIRLASCSMHSRDRRNAVKISTGWLSSESVSGTVPFPVGHGGPQKFRQLAEAFLTFSMKRFRNLLFLSAHHADFHQFPNDSPWASSRRPHADTQCQSRIHAFDNLSGFPRHSRGCILQPFIERTEFCFRERVV